jgi:hypothetical protein
MKKKNLLQLFLFVSLGVIYVTTSSSSNGKFMGGTDCATCHGSQNTNTTILLDGLPTAYTLGQTYNLTFTIINTSQAKAGFNIKCSAGTFVQGTGSYIKTGGSEITHTAPMTMSGSQAIFTFNWIAPSSGNSAITFNAVGNAVNGNNGSDAGDQWNNLTATIPAAAPSSVTEINNGDFSCYPNPVTQNLTIQGLSTDTRDIMIFGITGQVVVPSFIVENHQCVIDCSRLVAGTYVITANQNGQKVSATFSKQ